MNSVLIEEGERFSLLRFDGFAPGHAHAFVVRGQRQEPLLEPGPIRREQICLAAGIGATPLYLAKQVHGATPLDAPFPAGTGTDRVPPEADALVSRRPGCAVAVATADCLPILLATAGFPCAAVHAGWRGLLAGVIGAAIESVRAQPETARSEHTVPGVSPADPGAAPPPIEVAIGPAIGPCCFEVGEEVAGLFLATFSGRATGLVRPGRPGKSFVDLGAAALALLGEAGIPASSVHSAALCTRCGGERFESYRRDGPQAGRMIALIAPRSPLAPWSASPGITSRDPG